MSTFLYIANIRFPTEKAHGVQIAKTCEALMRRGILSGLWVSDRRTDIEEPAEAYYGVRTPFPISRIPVMDTVSWGRLGYVLETISFALAAARRLGVSSSEILYCRDSLVLWILSRCTRMRYVWESHTGQAHGIALAVAKNAYRVVVISEGLRQWYIARGVPAGKIVVAHDGIDLDALVPTETRETARTRLGLPPDRNVALYIGRVDGWKGIDTFCQSASLLPDTACAIIGGEPGQIASLKSKYPEMHFLGPRPYRDIANNMQSADALVLPNTANDIISAQFTSPLKLFAYLSSGIAVIASDLPSIREVADESAIIFVRPDSPEALARGITQALTEDQRARTAAAKAIVAAYTWDARTQILGTILSTI